MKQLIRRLARVGDSSQYSPISSSEAHPTRLRTRIRRRASSLRRSAAERMRRSGGVPEGHVPVYVGEEMERFVVSAEVLNHPVFTKLLNQSAQEYGYDHKGALRIPCHVLAFERLLEALRLGNHDLDVDDYRF